MSLAGHEAALATVIVRRRGRVAAVWALACVVLLPIARRIESVLGVAARVNGSESAAVDEQLVRRFHSAFAHPLLLVVSGVPSPSTPVGARTLQLIADSVRKIQGVARVATYLDGRDSIFLGIRNGETFLVVGTSEQRAPDQLLDDLRPATSRLARTLRPRWPNIALRWTGEGALNADLRRTSARDARSAEWRALPVTFLLLLVAFGAVTAALLPVGAALLAIGISLGIAAIAAHFWPLSILLQNVVTMIGLGLGIDYSLLMVQRFRTERARASTNEGAARAALVTAGPTILLSGTTVAIGFGALATLPVNELRAVAVGGLIVTVVSMLLATTLLPGALAMLGDRVDYGGVLLNRQHETRASRWRSWSTFVTRRPALVLIVATLPVCALAWQARRLVVGQPRGNWLPPKMESAAGLNSMESMGRGAVVQTLRITLELPPGVTALDDSGWAATTRLARRLVADPAVSRVRSLPGLVAPLGGTLPRSALVAAVPEEVRESFLSRDGRIAMLEVIPHEGAPPAVLDELVKRLRAAEPVLATPRGVARARIGGLPALNVDYQDAVAGRRRFMEVVALIVAATFLVLALGFRSLLVPLKAIALNLLAVAAAFGAVTLVFQDGIGARLLGVATPLDAIFPAVPVLVFCVVFGLSMDYEVFLVARIREARERNGTGERAAIADGLAHTARLITSAAAIMIVVFGAFIFADFLLMKMLGFALAVAVLLDATVMRLAVSPAMLALAGKWNWWPGYSVRPTPIPSRDPVLAPSHPRSASAPAPSSPV
jgi:putative drug exporter of the RND superfamily